MRSTTSFPLRHVGVAVSALACVAMLAPACKDNSRPSKREKDQAKAVKDQELLSLAYPKSSGVLPKSIAISYDPATERSLMTLRVHGLRAVGASSASVTSVELHLSSSYKGKVRASDNPEGSVDGRVVARCAVPGLLAFSGAPGTLLVDGQALPFKEPKEGEPYRSIKSGAGWEEAVAFRFPTKDLIAAANSASPRLTFGALEVEFSNDARADFAEFVARLDPEPSP